MQLESDPSLVLCCARRHVLSEMTIRGLTATARGAIASLAVIGAGCSALLGSKDANFKNPKATADGGSSARFVTRLKVSPPTVTAGFGSSLAIYGRTLAVTAPGANVERADAGQGRADAGLERADAGVEQAAGAAYLYDLDHLDESPIRLTAPVPGTNDAVIPASDLPDGFSKFDYYIVLPVALDDQSVVLGFPAEDSGISGDPHDDSSTDSGAVCVFDRAHGGVQYLKEPTIAATDLFGTSLALSGGWLAVGAPGDDGSALNSGRVYLYQRNNGGFDESPTATLKPDIVHSGDSFGTSLSLEGDLLVVGAPGEASKGEGLAADPNDTTAKGDGAVYVYRLVNGTWNFEQYVKPNATVQQGFFGASVSVSNGRFATGSPGAITCGGAQPPGASNGAAYLYTKGSAGWTSSCTTVSTVPTLFGLDVSLLGTRFVGGAVWEPYVPPRPELNGLPQLLGAAFTFDVTSDFHGRSMLSPPGAAPSQLFGYSVALAPGLVVVGAPWESTGGMSGSMVDPTDVSTTWSGAVYLFSTEP